MHSWFSSSLQSSRRSTYVMAGLICLLGALALGGCGVTIDTGIGGAPKSSSPQPGGSTGSTSPGTGPKTGGMSVKPCPGSDVTPGKSPTIVLTVTDSHKTTQAHVGDVIAVQLSANMHWTSTSDGMGTILTPLQPQGGMDEPTHTCNWYYSATSAGSANLSFIGVMICEHEVACPAIAEDEEFAIQVS